MKKLKLSPSERLGSTALCAGLCVLGGSVLDTHAQLNSAQKRQLSEIVGGRAETATILGSSDSIGGGNYTFDRPGNDAELDMFKIGGRGPIGEPRPFGSGDWKWNPVLYGVLGHITGDNTINRTSLRGNKIESSITSVQFGGGVDLHVTDRFSVTPTIGMIYGHGEYEFDAKTAAGRALGNLDTDFDTIGVVPGIAVAYKLPVGKHTIEFSSGYAFYGTSDIGDSGPLDVGGSAHEWVNKIDADFVLPGSLWNCGMHTGGYVSRTDLFGDITDSLRSDFFYSLHARFLLNTEGKLWKMSRLGLGATYTLGDDFTGVDFGVEVNFKF